MTNNKLIDGPFGIKMRDSTAMAVESLLKTLPKECREIKRKSDVPSSSEFIPGERADISLVSAESIDRDGEVILAKGMNLEFFRANPIVTLAHRYDELPVGKAQWIKIVPGGIKAKSVYSQKPSDWQGPWLPDAVWQMTKEGILKGKSIGFLPTKIRPPSGKETQWKNARNVIETGVLLEYAVAPIPCNQDALVEAVAKGYADEATLKRLGLTTSKPAKIKKHFDETAILLKALAQVSLDPEAIADAVIRKMKERGRV